VGRGGLHSGGGIGYAYNWLRQRQRKADEQKKKSKKLKRKIKKLTKGRKKERRRQPRQAPGSNKKSLEEERHSGRIR